MVFFDTLFDQFLRSFDRVIVIAIVGFDEIRFRNFSARILIDGFDGFGTVSIDFITIQDQDLCWN
jgi:hypothetical protein